MASILEESIGEGDVGIRLECVVRTWWRSCVVGDMGAAEGGCDEVVVAGS